MSGWKGISDRFAFFPSSLSYIVPDIMSFFSRIGKIKASLSGPSSSKSGFLRSKFALHGLTWSVGWLHDQSGWSLRLKVPQNSRGAGRIFHAFEWVGKKSKLTGHQTKTSKLTRSCSSVNMFVQEIKEKLTVEVLNKRQTRRARPSFPRSTPFSLLSSSNWRPISVTCQGSDCKIKTTFRSRAHGLLCTQAPRKIKCNQPFFLLPWKLEHSCSRSNPVNQQVHSKQTRSWRWKWIRRVRRIQVCTARKGLSSVLVYFVLSFAFTLNCYSYPPLNFVNALHPACTMCFLGKQNCSW